MTSVEDIVSQVDSLPPLPDTALKLMNVMNDPRSAVDDIVEAIRYDQAVTGEVLRLCNSAYFGLSRKVTSLNDAMVCLGTVKVLQLVMSVYTDSVLSREQKGYGLEPGVLWKHSVAVALASSLFAQRLKLPNANLAFTAGLLHDVGKVILNEHVAEEFSEIVRRVTEDRLSFVEAEQQVLGFSHQEVGAMIAEKWQLPETIVRCIRFHHDAGSLDPPDTLVDTVYLANCVCLLLGIGLGEDGLYYRADQAVMDRHNLRETDLEAIGAQVMTDLQRVEQIFAGTAGTDHPKEEARR
ncbi:MAG: HDOD domain-containing protein [Phycisphaerae bacterium]